MTTAFRQMSKMTEQEHSNFKTTFQDIPTSLCAFLPDSWLLDTFT